jgi:hypothetical protein
MTHHFFWYRRILLLLAGLLILGSTGCKVRVQTGSKTWNLEFGPTRTLQPTYTLNPTYTPRPTLTPNPTYTLRSTYTLLPQFSATPTVPTAWTAQGIPTPGEGEISQFASEATASSQYSSSSWSAKQATGAPDTTACGDQLTAWASASSHTKDWLLLTYDQVVIPNRIVVYQTYHPGAVSQVQVEDSAGNLITVYTASPQNLSQCPYQLVITVKDVNTPVRSVRVSIDQSTTAGWNEIDAVQLIGRPAQ